MTKCIACDKEATARLSPDLDVKGVFACAEHVEEVHRDLFFAAATEKMNWFNKKYNNKKKRNANSRETH